jgi:aldose 1-epimerase
MLRESTIELAAGPLRLELSPAIGGSISTFEWNGGGGPRGILRRRNGPLEKVLDAASFPLVPYVNRIRGGCFSFRGRKVRLSPNMPGDMSPLHGQGWLGAWEVLEKSETRAILSFRHSAGEWPWDYEAQQEFEMDERSLAIALTCRNLSSEPMPCGLGQHPYFDCGPETRLDTRVTHAWTIDENVLPVEEVVADGRYDLRERMVCGQDLDNGFGGWNGETRMDDPEWPYDVTLSSVQARFFQLYSPRQGGIFVAEPVTHANAALNAPEEKWERLGMRVLGPDESMRLDMRIELSLK